MRHLITKEIAHNARANGWKLEVQMSNEYDHKGRQKQNGNVVAHHLASNTEFRVSNEVFLDCFTDRLSEYEFSRKYYQV